METPSILAEKGGFSVVESKVVNERKEKLSTRVVQVKCHSV